MADPVSIGSTLGRVAASLDRARAAQRRAQARGLFRPEEPPPGVPAHRARLAQAMPYPQARLSHLDSLLRVDVDRWFRVLVDGQPALDDPDPGPMLLLGPAGTGKTVAACAVATQLADGYGWRVGYCRVSDFLDDERPDGTHRLRGQLRRCDAVVLDDLGVQLSEWGEATLTEFVDQLVHPPGGAPPVVLIVTSNAPLDELEQRLAERLFSRLTARAWSFVVAGDDRRGEDLDDLGPLVGLPCPYGCLAGWLWASAEHVARVTGPEPDPDAYDTPGEQAGREGAGADGHWHGGPGPCSRCGGLAPHLRSASYEDDLRAWRERRAAATHTVRPCPHCRPGRARPSNEVEEPEQAPRSGRSQARGRAKR